MEFCSDAKILFKDNKETIKNDLNKIGDILLNEFDLWIEKRTTKIFGRIREHLMTIDLLKIALAKEDLEMFNVLFSERFEIVDLKRCLRQCKRTNDEFENVKQGITHHHQSIYRLIIAFIQCTKDHIPKKIIIGDNRFELLKFKN